MNMKQAYVQHYLKPILADRPYLFLTVGVLITGLVLALFVLLSVQQRDIQVVTQYSAFGESHFYKNKWFYLYAFAGFGVLVAAGHTALMAKLYNMQYRDIGLLFGWVSIVLCVIAGRYAYEVMQLAFL